MPTIQRQWTPHAGQRRILEHPARFRIAACGRRYGKTKMALGESFEYGFEHPGAYVWLVYPNYTDAFELGFEPMLELVPESMLGGEPKRTPPYKVFLSNGTELSFRSADKMSSLRGRGLDFLVIDEAGDTSDNAWRAELRPSLSDTGGRMLAIGTPRGRNWFHEWFQRGRDEDITDTASFHGTTYENPYVPDDEVESAREQLPERVFRREYLAEFVDDEGAVFGNVRERNGRTYRLGDVRGEPPYSTGIDLARASNYVAVTTLDADGMLVGFNRFTGGSWGLIRGRLESYLESYTPGIARLDASRDNKVVEDIQRAVDGLDIEPFKFTASNKAEAIENLAARLETGDIILPAGADQLLTELEAYEYEVTQSGNVSYSGPSSVHDDCVDSLAMAAKGIQVIDLSL